MEINKILTKELLAKRRVENNVGLIGGLYRGSVKDVESIFGTPEPLRGVKNTKKVYEFIVSVKDNPKWRNTAAYYEHWNRIEDQVKLCTSHRQNIAQFPDDYYDLIEMLAMDLTRRRVEEQDFTDQFSREIVNPNFSQSVNLKEFLPYVGAFLPRTGAGESVPLIEQKTGEKGSVDLQLYGLGHERSLEDELYNTQIYSLQKVMDAVSRAYTGARNALGIGQLTAAAFQNDQIIAADVSASYELALFRTLRQAIRVLYGLNDPQTKQSINASRIALVVGNNVIAWDLNRVLRGQLALSRSTGGAEQHVINVEPLPIDEIWVYKGDTLYAQGKEVKYDGVADGEAYLIVTSAVDNANYTLVKRNLTMEMGQGDVLTLAREKRAWYFVQGHYSKEFFGHTGGCDAGTGFCVKIELPTFEENT